MVDLMARERGRSILLGIGCVAAAMLALLTLSKFPNDWFRDTALLALLPGVATLAIATLAVFISRWRPALLMMLATAILAELIEDWDKKKRSLIPGS